MKKKYMILAIIVILIVLSVPITISELYKLNRGYMTPWAAEDTLAYSSAIISAIATFILGWVAIMQNKKANDINDRLLRIEEQYAIPSFCIQEDKSCFVEYDAMHVWLKINIKNLSNGIVDISEISNMQFHIFLTDKYAILNFNTRCLEYQTLLPGQEKQLDFSVMSLDTPLEISSIDFVRLSKNKFNFACKFDIKYRYKDSQVFYKEKIKVDGYISIDISSDKLYIAEQQITRIDYEVEKS